MPFRAGRRVGPRRARQTARRLARAARRLGLRRLPRSAPARPPAAHTVSRAATRATEGARQMTHERTAEIPRDAEDGTVLQKPVDRRLALKILAGGVAAGAQALSACAPLSATTDEDREIRLLAWREYIKGNYQFMTEEERAETIARLERLAKLQRGVDVTIQSTGAQPGVVFGYAFNISKCKGFRRCVEACINENNLDRSAATQYIRIFEMEDGVVDLDHADATFQHEVPAEGHFYLGTQCFQCADPPCVKVCPVSATWQEPDGITVVDYDWCIGCRSEEHTSELQSR